MGKSAIVPPNHVISRRLQVRRGVFVIQFRSSCHGVDVNPDCGMIYTAAVPWRHLLTTYVRIRHRTGPCTTRLQSVIRAGDFEMPRAISGDVSHRRTDPD